jgi:serine/threonine-protein kinase
MSKKDEIEKLKKEIAQLKTENFSLLKTNELLSKERENLNQIKEELEKENAALKKQVDRPKLKAEDLMAHLRNAMHHFEAGLKSEKNRVDYTLSQFDLDLKTSLQTDQTGELYFQIPFLGETVPAENLSNLKLAISSIPKPSIPLITVPNLIGTMKDTSIGILDKLGLKATVVEKASESPKDMIIGQNPEPYDEVPAETTVVLTVAKPTEIRVPKLIGMELADAKRALESKDLTIGQIEQKLSDADPGIILIQNPKSDTLVKVGSAIDVVVAAAGVEIPNIIGKSEKKARAILIEQDLKVGKVTERLSIFKGIVIEQNPAAGEIRLPGSQVDFVVAKRISGRQLKRFVQTSPEVTKQGVTAEMIMAAIDMFAIEDKDSLKKFVNTSDKNTKDKLKLPSLKVAKALKAILQKIEKQIK